MWGWEGLYGRPEQDAGDHKGPPFHSPPLSPLRMLMGLVFGWCLLDDREGRSGSTSTIISPSLI